MDLGIQGRVALVTGGSRGLGLAAARSLAGEGCAVAVAARGREGAEAAAAELRRTGVRAHAIALDMGDATGPARAVAETEESLGPLDILVANAGGPPRGGFLDVEEPDWDLALRQNLLGTIRLIRAALPGMRARRWGRIVTITSATAREAIDGLVLSNATRPGVSGAVRSLAREVGHDGVLVTNVMPGPVLTDRLREALDTPEKLAARAACTALGRLGDPAEVGDLVAFLASARASFITGCSIFVDGGESRAVA